MKKGKVSLPKYGVRKKMIPRKGRPIEFGYNSRPKPNAGRIFKKEDKTVYETKEFKGTLTTKDIEAISLAKLAESIGSYPIETVKLLLKDYRKGAKHLAEEELARREG